MMQQCYYDCKNHAVNLKSIKTMLFKYKMIPRAWASEGLLPGRAIRGFCQNFLGGPKVVKFRFSNLKLRKQSFFTEIFKIQGGLDPLAPFPTVMTKGITVHIQNCTIYTVVCYFQKAM